MLMLKTNEQEIKYAIFTGSQEIETSGEAGTWTNPITGQVYNLDNTTGDSKPTYGEVTTDYVNISLGNNRDDFEPFGFSNGDYNGTIAATRGEFDFTIGTLIWFGSEVEYVDDEQTEVNPKSADYTVIGIIPTINEVKYLLKGVI